MRWKPCLPCNICILSCIMWTLLKPLCDAQAFDSASVGAQRSLQEIYVCVCVHTLSHVQLFATPWTVACQAPLSMGFPRQEYWSGLLFPTPYICTYCDNTYHSIWCNICSLLWMNKNGCQEGVKKGGRKREGRRKEEGRKGGLHEHFWPKKLPVFIIHAPVSQPRLGYFDHCLLKFLEQFN